MQENNKVSTLKSAGDLFTDPSFYDVLIDHVKETNECATYEDFWDCNCDEKYIHFKGKAGEEQICPVCGLSSEDAPDSRICEVLKSLKDAIISLKK